jgi:hypothetical protein
MKTIVNRVDRPGKTGQTGHQELDFFHGSHGESPVATEYPEDGRFAEKATAKWRYFGIMRAQTEGKPGTVSDEGSYVRQAE